MRVASLVVVCTLITSCLVSSTFAKYTSSASGSSTATVAKWSIMVGGKEIADELPQTIDFSLFDTILDSDGISPEEDVVVTKIAPGTKGSFVINVKNTSEVTANFKVVLTKTSEQDLPITYKIDVGDGQGAQAYTLGDEITLTGVKATNPTSDAQLKPITVTWEWPYDGGNDATDTGFGIDPQEYTVNATITATQAD